MSIRLSPDDDHEVVGSGLCMGYTDSFGKLTPDFYCPNEDYPSAIYCCGTLSYKYCCTTKDEPHSSISDLAMILCIIGGATFVIAILVCISCIICHFKRQTNKRSTTVNGPLYRMHCSSTGSGVANMYSFSNQNSSATTPIDMNGPVHHLVELDYHEATVSASAGSYSVEPSVQTPHSFAAVDLIPKNAPINKNSSREEVPPPPYESAVPVIIPSVQTSSVIVDIREDPPSSPTPQPSPDIPSQDNDEDRIKDNHLSPESAALMVPGVHTLKLSRLCSSQQPLQITGQTNREDSLYWSTKF